MSFRPPGQCPVCGEWVPRGAAACDDCGACAKSGWQDDSGTYDGLDLPDEEFDYEDFVAREFGGKSSGKKTGAGGLWWWVGVVLIIVLVAGYLLAAG